MNIKTFNKALNEITGLNITLAKSEADLKSYDNEAYIEQSNQVSGRFTKGYNKKYVIFYNGVKLKTETWSYFSGGMSDGINKVSSASEELIYLLETIKNDSKLLELLSKEEEVMNEEYGFDSIEDLKNELTIQDYALLFQCGYSINDLYDVNLNNLKSSDIGIEIISIFVTREKKLNELYKEYGDLFDGHPDGIRYFKINERLEVIDKEIKSLRGEQNA